MLGQGKQEERNHVIWETTTQSPILAFKPPNPQDIRNKKTKEQIIKKTRGARSKEQDA